MNTKLILRTLTSPFATPYADITKDNVLSRADVDNNFIYLKGETIYSAETGNGTITLKKLNGNDITFASSANTNTYVTGGTFTSPTLTLTRNDGVDVTVNGITSSVGNQLLSGGASYLSGLTFDITPLTYIINGIYYSANSSTVVVSSGDSTYDRIDVIVVDISGNTSVVQGTPAANPVKPDINESTQLEVTFITVAMGATTIALSNTLVYNEKVGPPTEWTFATPSSPFISGNSTTTSYSGTVSIALSGATNAKSFTLSSSTIFNSITQNTLQFAIKNKIAWPASTRLRITILSSTGVQIGTYVDLYNARFGFSSSNITSWQLLSIPLSNFALTTTLFSQIKVLTVNSGAAAINCYIDYIRMVEGVPSASPNPTWFNMRVDNGTSIPALVTNDTLTLSGGTNIGTRIVGPRAIVFDLDGNINLTGVTATTISATTYLNLPSSSGSTGGGFSGFTGGTGIDSIRANNSSNLKAIGRDSFVVGSATTATTVASVAMGYSSIANGGFDYIYADSGITVTSAVTITTTDPTYLGVYGYAIKFTGVNVASEWLSYLNTYSSIFSLSGTSGFLPNGTTMPVIDVYSDGSNTYIINDLVPSATTVTSGMTMVASDPFTSMPAIKFTGIDVSTEWNTYINSFGSTFTLYGGTGATTTFDSTNAPYIYFDGSDTYMADETAVITDLTFTQISGNTFAFSSYLSATGYTKISGTTFISVTAGTIEYPAFTFGAFTSALGRYSHAEGYGTIASGTSSHAEGNYSVAYSQYSHAEGNGTATNGIASHSEGQSTLAFGDYSHSEGLNTRATGHTSHAEGYLTSAINTSAHAEGFNTTASGTQSHAEGSQTIASGAGSHTEGTVTIAVGTSSHAEGEQTTAVGLYSHSEGRLTTAIGDNSHAGGYNTIASGLTSYSEGGSTIAGGAGSHAEGILTRALGETSHAEGSQTTSSGQYSHAEGNFTTASGILSHAEGDTTTAGGNYSHAEGQSNIASGSTTHVEGYLTTALSNISHAEGSETLIGWRAFSVSSVVAGLITISDNIDYSAEFASGAVFLDGVYYSYNTINFSSPNFTIQLDDTSINAGLYVSDGNNLNNPLATNLLGNISHAEGKQTTAFGENSHAEGWSSTAVGHTSHAEGISAAAIGGASHAEGYHTIANGAASHAEGNASVASAANAHAEGNITLASGDNSHAEGYDTIASGGTSHAEGDTTTAIGDNSHSEGNNTAAIGHSSHTEGDSTTAIGISSHAGGILSIASGQTSFVHGSGSTAGGNCTIVLGANITGVTNNTVYVPNFVIKKSSAVPTSSADSVGEIGSVTWDNTYFYWRTNSQWLRISGSTF